MREDSEPDQEEKAESHELLPAENWETAFSKAGEKTLGELRQRGAPSPSQATAVWVKAMLPVLIVVVYLVVKLADRPRDTSGAFWQTSAQTDTLSGVEPESQPVKLERAVRDALTPLENYYRRGEWQQLRESAASIADPDVRNHPIIQALVLLSRSRSGERNIDLERGLINSETTLKNSGDRYAGLLQELRLTQVEQILSRSPSRENFAHNIDLIHRLTGPEADSERAVQVRGKLARTFENFGDELAEEGRGILQNDVIKLREARHYYQSGLRYVVKSDRWYQLDPISRSASTQVERLLQKIREMNRLINGASLPFTSSDSYSWTGRKGDPVHDVPVK